MKTATIRDLRNRFPAVKELVESAGEVIVTDKGKPRYKLSLYSPAPQTPKANKDYMARLRRHQPRPISASEARALHEENRGDR